MIHLQALPWGLMTIIVKFSCTDLLSTDAPVLFCLFFLLWNQHKAAQIFTTFTLWKWLVCRAGYWSTAKAEDGQKNKKRKERERGVSVHSSWWHYVYISPCRALVFVEGSASKHCGIMSLLTWASGAKFKFSAPANGHKVMSTKAWG